MFCHNAYRFHCVTESTVCFKNSKLDARQRVISPRVRGGVGRTLCLWTGTFRGAYGFLARRLRRADNCSIVGFGCINSKYSVTQRWHTHVLMVSVTTVLARSRELRMYRFTESSSSGKSGLPPFRRKFKHMENTFHVTVYEIKLSGSRALRHVRAPQPARSIAMPPGKARVRLMIGI